MQGLRRATVGAAVLAAALSLACARNRGITFYRANSVNLGIPQARWPGDPRKMLTPAQQDVYDLRGNPNFIRFWWKGQDDYSTNLEVPREIDSKTLASVRQSWIYLRQGDEVIFDSPVVSHSEPISDRLKIVLKDGDPEDRKYIPGALGQEDEEWHYYSTGMVYRFHQGKLIEQRRQHDPIPGYLKR